VAQGQVLEGELAVAAEQEGEESKQVDLTVPAQPRRADRLLFRYAENR